MTDLPLKTESLNAAIRAAQEMLLAKQSPVGAWFAASDMGPICTAQVVATLHWVGALQETHAVSKTAIRWLRTQQRLDGAFPGYPFAQSGSLAATASAWAAFAAAGLPPNDPSLQRARAYVEANGGIPALREALVAGDFSLILLVMAGEADPGALPHFPIGWVFSKTLVGALQTRVHAGVLLGALQLGAIERKLKGKWGDESQKKSMFDARACERLLKWQSEWQNADGSINGNSIQTALGLAALHAVGVGAGDARFDGAVASLLESRRETEEGCWFFAFEADVWTTALNARALVASGISPRDPRIERAIDYLLACQSSTQQPLVNQRREGAPRTGGWAFQKQNTTMVDCDDTGMVLGVLATLLGHPEGVQQERAEKMRVAITQGRQWLKGMQNPDGGWSAFVWGLRSRRVGAIMTEVDRVPKKFRQFANWAMSPPEAMSDPSTEDVTARVLYGLAKSGDAWSEPETERGLLFLRHHQRSHGGFWGRWVVNYLPSTAYAIIAAGTLGLSRDTQWVRSAIGFVLSRQNPNGGFGETECSYKDPALAGRGESTPPLTAIVLGALVDIGMGDSETARKAAAYLLSTQNSDGTWSGQGYLATFVPPEGFYEYPATVDYAPLEALAKYSQATAKRDEHPRRKIDVAVDLQLNEAASQADALADAAIEAAERSGISVTRLMLEAGGGAASRIASLWDGKPLPLEVRRYFKESQKIPRWASPKKIAIAREILRKNSFAVGNALFFATLPQSYASAEGAKILFASYGLAGGTRQRILRTSEFVYSVLCKDALASGGAGIRSCQRVRLGHAAVRSKLRKGGWDASRPPIHQEHLLGTTLLLSVTVLDALPRLGVKLTEKEEDAWVHFWSVVGALLGTATAILPENAAEARVLMERIRVRQWAPSEEGKELTRALVNVAQEYVRVPGLAVSMIRHLSGDACADLLDLDPSDHTREWIEIVVANQDVLPSKLLLRDFSFLSTRALMRTQHLAFRGASAAKKEAVRILQLTRR